MDFDFKPEAHNVCVVAKKENMGGEIIEYYEWRNMTPQHLIRWDWYFRYREALLRVKYPREYVGYKMWKTKPTDKTEYQMALFAVKNRITTCRRMITKLSNAIDDYETGQKTLLIPNWNDPGYLKAKDKLENYKRDLNKYLQEQLNLKIKNE